jgi:digeranylgeranylglycerophospholipid reductase
MKEMGIKRSRVVRKMGGYVPLGGPLPVTYADGVLVVGDAAGQTGPIFGEGITRAIVGGKIAGEVGAKALQAGDISKKGLSEYRKWEKVLATDLLLEGKGISRRIRAGQPLTAEELEVFSKALDHIKVYW